MHFRVTVAQRAGGERMGLEQEEGREGEEEERENEEGKSEEEEREGEEKRRVRAGVSQNRR